MPVQLNAYLSFKNQAREAMQFYQTVFGGALDLATFEDFGMTVAPEERQLIMHGMLRGERGISFMGSDTPSQMPYQSGARISMALSGDDDALLRGYFAKLSEGGTVQMPLNQAPWGDAFGSCTDRFGVVWMVNIAAPK